MPSFTREQDITLIKIIGENSVIYNSTVGITKRDEREKVWHKIGDAVQKTVPECKARWTNIRDNVRRNLKHKQKKTNYKYDKYLGFLVEYLKSTIKDHYDGVDELDDLGTLKTEEIFVVVGDHNDNVEGYPSDTTDDDDKPNEFSNNDVVSTSQQLFNEPIKPFLKAVEATLVNLNPFYLNKAKSKIFQIVQDCELQQIVDKENKPIKKDP